MQEYDDKWRRRLAVRCRDAGGGRCGGAGVAGGGRHGDGEMLPDEAVEETRREEGGEDGDEEQRWL